MYFSQRRAFNISLFLMLCLLLAPFLDAAELSLFDKLKLKTSEKLEQLQQRDWWITKAAGKVAGFIAGKAGGAIGAAAGYVLGAAVGGPVAAGIGAMLGFRIGDIVTKTFAKAVGELVAQWKLNNSRKVDLGAVVDAVKTVNKASLSAESIGAVFGDLVGGSMGAAAGIAFLAAGGPIALPVLGTISAAYLGSKLGKTIGAGIGRWIGRKVLKKGYEAYAASDDEKIEEQLEATLVKIEEPGSLSAVRVSDIFIASPTTAVSDTSDARSSYEKAYRQYTDLVTSPNASDAEKKAALQVYRQAYEVYRASVAADSFSR